MGAQTSEMSLFSAPFEPLSPPPPKIPKSLEYAPTCVQKCIQNGSTMCSSKNKPRPFGVLKWDNAAQLGRVLIQFSAFPHI